MSVGCDLFINRTINVLTRFNAMLAHFGIKVSDCWDAEAYMRVRRDEMVSSCKQLAKDINRTECEAADHIVWVVTQAVKELALKRYGNVSHYLKKFETQNEEYRDKLKSICAEEQLKGRETELMKPWSEEVERVVRQFYEDLRAGKFDVFKVRPEEIRL